MNLKNIDKIEVLRIGIQVSIDEYNFLSSAYQKVRNENVKTLLSSFLLKNKQQRKHLEQDYTLSSGYRLLYFNTYKKFTFSSSLPGDISELDLIQIFIDRERKIIAYFESLAKRSFIKSGRFLLEKFALEKQNRVDLLQQEYFTRVRLVAQ